MADKAQKTTPVRLTDESIRWARIASGYTGESVSEYVSRIIEEQGRADVERLHAETALEIQAATKTTKTAKGKRKAAD